jgi:7-carboxy-7-deazaguanine synthase (Cx14CxxC type)
MAYAIKELFRTLQGEGVNTGRLAVFCRFAGCNLWSGREQDRGKGSGGCAAWCDTDFVGTDGEGGGKFADAEALADAAWRTWGHPPRVGASRPLLVCTGGEPLLQLDTELVAAFRARGFEVAIETNGTIAVPPGVDWVCVSPKARAELIVIEGDELKLVVPQAGMVPADFLRLRFAHFYLQPMDGPERESATRYAVDYCHQHPEWRLSLQSHKFIGIP